MQLLSSDGTMATSCLELSPANIKTATSPLAAKIVALLGAHPDGLHASEIARLLKQEEQKIHYHVQRLRSAGILVIDRLEDTKGATAKVLRLKAGAFALRGASAQPIAKVTSVNEKHAEFLSPFITDGRWDARVIVGSPDPHGPEGARSRDASYAIDLGLFLGMFLATPASPAVLLDTELRDWKQNLIIIGGPVVNKAAERLNAHAPISYDTHTKEFKSASSGKRFSHESVGVIVKMPNPFASGKWILLIQGKRYLGTRAAIVALTQQFDTVCASPKRKGAQARIVEGIDADSDGIVDAVRFLE